MGFSVEPYRGERSPYSASMSRRRGLGEMDEMEELFEQLAGGEGGELGEEELEDFDWKGLWDSFMEGEGEGEGFGSQQGQIQGANRPTMFGAPNRPGGFSRERGLGFNYY